MSDSSPWVLEAVFRNALRDPLAAAVRCEGATLSYRALVTGACELSHRLGEVGVREGDVVAFPAERFLETPVFILGILTAGAAYLPLGREWDTNELLHVMGLAQPMATVFAPGASADWETKLDSAGSVGAIIRMDPCADTGVSRAGSLLRREAPAAPSSSAPAYVLFTSGSSGARKGVVIENRALANLAGWANRRIADGRRLHVLGLSEFTFDLSVLDLFLALGTGGAYSVVPASEVRSPKRILRRLSVDRCNFVQTVPSLFREIVRFLDGLDPATAKSIVEPVEEVVLAGEALHADLPKGWFRHARDRCNLRNMYGPTETIHVTAHLMRKPEARVVSGRIPIGEPLDGIQLELIDDDGSPLSGPSTGELVIGGVCVARGYLGEIDSESGPGSGFELDPNTRSRRFRTADVFDRDSTGRLRFVGRRDDIIKLAGVRCSLIEFESAAVAHPEVASASATAIQLPTGATRVGLAIVPTAGTQVQAADIRRCLTAQMPHAAGQIDVAVVDELPRTARGKTDREAIARIVSRRRFATTELAPARRYFAELDRLKDCVPEHPQATLLIPASFDQQSVLSALHSTLREEPTLLWEFDDKDENRVRLRVMPSARELQTAVAEPSTTSPSGPAELVRRVASTPLLMQQWPAFRLGAQQIDDSSTAVSFRCHHTLASGPDVLRILTLIIRNLSRGGRLSATTSIRWWRPDSDEASSTADERDAPIAQETRTLYWQQPESTRQLMAKFRPRNVTFGIGLLALHAFTLRQIEGRTEYGLEMPMLQSAHSVGNGRPALVAGRGFPELRTLLVPAATGRPTFETHLSWARTVYGASQQRGSDPRHRWNFTPIDRFLVQPGTNVALVPLDLYEPLPPLTNRLRTSVLAQTISDQLLLVIRAPNEKWSAEYRRIFAQSVAQLLVGMSER